MVGCFANPSYSFILGGRRLATLELTDLYRSMLLIRRTEQLLSKLFANGIVGAGMSLALGSALALQVRKTRNVASVFFGDGAMAEGLLRESRTLWREVRRVGGAARSGRRHAGLSRLPGAEAGQSEN